MPTPRLNFYGDSTRWLVDNGVKLLTLRMDNPKYAEIQAGETIVLQYESDFRVGFVFSRQVKPLREYTPAELILDGYMSAEEAAADLARYYEGVTLDTPMLGIGFSTESHYTSYLDKRRQQLLLKTPLYGAVAMSEFHDLFMPAFLGWAIIKAEESGDKLTVTRWHNFLSNHLGTFNPGRLALVRTADETTKKFYKGLRHKAIRWILTYEMAESPKYKSVVLCQPVLITD